MKNISTLILLFVLVTNIQSQDPPLPVDLINFEAKKVNNKIALTWSTATELNNDKFIIEHSSNGVSFERIGKVSGNGTTTKTINYSFSDNYPEKGLNYYRLKQIDLDGSFIYSDVINIALKQLIDIKVYPNPVIDVLYLQNDQSETGQAFLYSSSAQLLNTYYLGTGVTSIDLNDCPVGVYYIKLVIGKLNVNEKIIVK